MAKYFENEEGKHLVGPTFAHEEQKYKHVRMARKLLKQFSRYDQKLFMNVVAYDESWMHYFEPHRKISNRVWLTKMQEDLGVS